VNWPLHVEPGVSNFTTTANNLGIDPLERGTLVVDANRLLLFEQLPDPAFNTFVYHVGGADQAELLQRLLLRAYDASTPPAWSKPDRPPTAPPPSPGAGSARCANSSPTSPSRARSSCPPPPRSASTAPSWRLLAPRSSSRPSRPPGE